MSLKGRKIVAGITGGIAAYKMPDFIRRLIKEGAEVRAVITANGARFVAEGALATVTKNDVITSLWPDKGALSPSHISLAEWADLLLVAPATANIIGKFASGIADDFLSTFYLSVKCPVVVAPAMNGNMLLHPAVTDNIRVLKKRGVQFAEPAFGELACLTEGKGRLAAPEDILFAVEKALTEQDMAGKRVLVTCGGTEEAIDPVRVITNRSSGRMGMAVARNAALRGAEVTLVHGRTDVPPPVAVRAVAACSAADMLKETAACFKNADVLVMAAAVSDFTPENPSAKKIKKEKGLPAIRLKPTVDILARLAASKGKRKIVGFALESEDLIASAREKMRRKKCDLIIANPPCTLGSDSIELTLIGKDGKAHPFGERPKPEAAALINDFIVLL